MANGHGWSTPRTISVSISIARSATRPRCGRRNDSIHGISGLSVISADLAYRGTRAGEHAARGRSRPGRRGRDCQRDDLVIAGVRDVQPFGAGRVRDAGWGAELPAPLLA